MAGFQVMPRLSADEFAALEADIVENGVRVPITVAEDGRIVDGHHRDEIARRHGLHCPRVTASGDDGVLRSLAFSLNVNRRHLSREQKRVLVAESLRADPILRDREHARRCGVNHETVGRVRADEGIPTPDEVIRAEIERSGDNDYQIGQRLGVSQNTVSKVRADFQNGENRQNENTTPEPSPEPDEPPTWEPAGSLRPADLAALNNEKKSIFLPKPTPEHDKDLEEIENKARALSSAPGTGKDVYDTPIEDTNVKLYDNLSHARQALSHLRELESGLMVTGGFTALQPHLDELSEKIQYLHIANQKGNMDTQLEEIVNGTA